MARILILSLIIMPACLYSMEYRVWVDGVMDNTEYGGPAPLADRTVFFARGGAEAGFQVDSAGHNIRAGVACTQEFGAQRPDPSLLLYYHYDREALQFRFGAFPRAGALELPEWFFGPDSSHYRHYAHGAAVEARRWGAAFCAWVDWTGLQGDTTKEAFLFGYGVKYARGQFVARHEFMMEHLAFAKVRNPDEYVRDNGGVSFEAGGARGRTRYFDTLTVMAGAIVSLDRDRGDGIWHTPMGAIVSGQAALGVIAVRGLYYTGEPQRLRHGSPFFAYSGFESFGRIDIGALLCQKENIKAELFQSFHFFDGKTGYSQHFRLNAELRGGTKKEEEPKKKRKGFGIRIIWGSDVD